MSLAKYKNSLFILFYLTCTNYSSFDPLLLDEKSLTNTTIIQNHLQNYGFQKIYFQTPDNLKICGLFLDQSKKINIKGTIIYCAGFYPGTKEGMSSFYALVADQPYNFLLFDARGHQESEGSLFSYTNLKNYGSSEFQDIIGACNFLKKYNDTHHINQKIIIHGICSGAFHAIKAYHHIQNQEDITGIIFDSGWLHVTDIVQPTIYAEVHKRLQNTLFAWATSALSTLISWVYRFTLQKNHASIQGIKNLIAQTKCPIFFIHCIHDPYVPINPIAELTNTLQCTNCWWIEHKSHVNFHTQEPETYAKKIKDFLNNL